MEQFKHYVLSYLQHCKLMCVLCIILVIGCIASITYALDQKCIDKIPNEILAPSIEEEMISEEVYFVVDIKGAVKKPGIYRLKEGGRVQDVIDASGGLTKTADVSLINLSKKIVDEMIIKIYTKAEVKQMHKEIEIVCKCPDVKNDGCINISKQQETTKISINTATKEELQKLSGIGESIASKIILYREEHGPFQKIEDLKNVSGIGDSIYSKISEAITL